MADELDRVRRKLDALAAAIADGNIGTSPYWGGAGVVIASVEHWMERGPGHAVRA